MVVTNKKLTAFIFAALAATAPVWGQSPEEVSQIEQAMPAKATAQPEKPRKVLVFSQAIGYHHASIPYGDKAFEIMGKKSGAFTADVTSDPAALDPENLKKYDAIILNNTTGDFLTTESVRQGLLDFVKSGKGLVGIHAATDSNYAWPEFGDMIGGYFDEHPWTSGETVTLKIDRPDHPVAKAFGGKPFTVKDETYQFKEPYSRERDLVLTSLDVTKTDMTKPKIKRTDGDFAVSWVKPYGDGRVFYCSLGHNKEIYWNETVVQHYLDGIQFALGDLKAPDNADAKVANGLEKYTGVAFPAQQPSAVDRESVAAAITAMKGYDFGGDRAFLNTIDEAIRQTNGKDAQREEIANALSDVANDEALSYAARELALRRIEYIGGAKQVELTEGLLTSADARLADMARISISGIPADRADKALLKALDNTTGTVKEGIILSLGERQVGGAVKPLTAIARGSDEVLARTAIMALGDISNEDAAKALLDDIRPPDAIRETWFMALNDAGSSLGKGNRKLAARLFERVMQLGEKSPARLAAFKGSAMLEDSPEAVALKTLDGDDPMLNQVAREILVRGKDSSITPQLLQRLETAKGNQKVAVVEILGAREDKAALAPIVALAEKPDADADLKVAAIRALETLADQNVVPKLLKIAADSKGAVAAAANSTLKDMPLPEVDTELLKLAVSAPSPEEQVVAIEAIAARKSPDAMTILMQATEKNNPKVSVAAFKAAAELGSADDLDALLKAEGAATDEKVLREGARAVTVAAGKVKNRTEAVSKLLAAESASASDGVKVSLLGVLGNLGTQASLEVLQKESASANDAVKDAAVRALASFPEPSAMDDLLKIASESPSEVHRVLAVRGVARLLSEPAGRTATQRIEMLNKALELAKGVDDKKAVIGAAADMKVPGILPILLQYMDQPELHNEVVAAVLKQAPVANQFNPQEAAELLNPLKAKLEKADWDKLEEALQPGGKDGGALRAWQASTVYHDDDGKANIKSVLAKTFAPETGDVEWPDALYAAKDEGDDKLGELELDRYYPGSKNAAIYIRTHVWSPEDRKARLDTGSDDGMTAWVNGTQVFTFVKSRSFAWWGDKTNIDLKRGWNTVMLKIGNGGGDWTSAARIVSADGKPMEDLKISAAPQDK